MEYLFCYGTLQKPDIQEAVLGRQVPGAPDRLDDYTTETIHEAGADYLRAIPKKGALLPGQTIVVTEPELKKIDAYEGTTYARELVRLQSGTTAWIYQRPRP